MESNDQKMSYMSDDPKSQLPPHLQQMRTEEVDIAIQRRSFKAWIKTVWTLAIHTILSIGITVFVLFYIKDRPFNVSHHFAPVQIIDGNRTLPFAPVQSDVVTILSSMIDVQKWALVAWVAPLCWRISMFLMERRGLRHQDLEVLIKYQLLTPGTYRRSWAALLIGTLLLAISSAGLSTPIITGSISWIPENHITRGLSTGLAEFWDVEAGSLSPLVDRYRLESYQRELSVAYSAGQVNRGWGRDPEKGACKLVSDSIGTLAVNSTIKNVTLPYFEVHSVEWIDKVADIPNFPTNGEDIEYTLLNPLYLSNPTNISWLPLGYALLIPNTFTNWSSDPMNSTIISERRLLIFYYAYDEASEASGIYNITNDLPVNAYRVHEGISHLAFAWVTFSAGVGRCKEYNCVVSSPSTIRNNTPIELEPHPLTFKALSVATSVSLTLLAENSSVPYVWHNLNDYIEAVLVRSYSGAWAQLNFDMSNEAFYSSYFPSLPGLLADVDTRRVYGWLGLQLFVTLLSIIFLVLQCYLSKFPLIGDTALTAFYLDTMGVAKGDDPDPFMNRTLKVTEEGNQLKLRVDSANV